MISKNDIFSKKEVEESIDNKAPYVGKEEPTTDTVLWIDPTGTPSGGNGGTSGGSSGSGEPYFLPLRCIEGSYTFSAAEAQKFKDAISRADTTYHFGYVEGNFIIYLPLQAEAFNKGRMYLRGIQPVATADAFGMCIWVFFIEYNDESVVCAFEQFTKNIA